MNQVTPCNESSLYCPFLFFFFSAWPGDLMSWVCSGVRQDHQGSELYGETCYVEVRSEMHFDSRKLPLSRERSILLPLLTQKWHDWTIKKNHSHSALCASSIHIWGKASLLPHVSPSPWTLVNAVVNQVYSKTMRVVTGSKTQDLTVYAFKKVALYIYAS